MLPKSILILPVLLLIISCTKAPEQTLEKMEVNQMPVKKVLFIIAPKNYQDHEYAAPKELLEKAGLRVVTASQKAGTCQGTFGSTAQATLSLDKVNVADYVAIIFIGGSGATIYQHDSQAHSLAQAALQQNKVLAAICIAPTTLAYAGVLKGKKATVWNGDGQQEAVLAKNGATFTNQEVTVDGNLITANGPPAAEKFGKVILEKLR